MTPAEIAKHWREQRSFMLEVAEELESGKRANRRFEGAELVDVSKSDAADLRQRVAALDNAIAAWERLDAKGS